MKLKKEYIVLAAVIVALCLILILRRNDRTHYKLPEPEPVGAERITRLVLSRGDSTVTLERHAGLWKIEPYGYPADTGEVSGMLKAIAGFTLTALASEAGNDVPYELDAAKRIDVEVFEGDRSLMKLAIGKPASTYQHTFVRLGSDPRIYQARENLRSAFGKEVERLRDKVVLTIDRDYVTGISFIGKDGSLVLRHVGDLSGTIPAGGDTTATAPTWQTADGQAADEQAVERVLDRLVRLTCDRFIPGRKKDEYTKPIFTLRVIGSDSASLSIFDKGEETSYPAVSSECEYPFFLAEWNANQIMKKPDELLKKDAAAPPSGHK